MKKPGKRKPRPLIPKEKIKNEQITDLEVAKKMLKIHQSAQDRNLEFDLSFESVKKLMTYPNCYYTNKVFEEDGLFARSFDRIDSAKGYIEGNVVACTVDINSKKSNLSLDELTLLYKKLVTKNAKENKIGPPVTLEIPQSTSPEITEKIEDEK